MISSRFDRSVVSLSHASYNRIFFFSFFLFSPFLLSSHPGKSNLRTSQETSADREMIIPLLSRIFYCNCLWFVKGGHTHTHTRKTRKIRSNGRNISSILIQRTGTMIDIDEYNVTSNRYFSTNNWTQKFVSTKQRSIIYYDTNMDSLKKKNRENSPTTGIRDQVINQLNLTFLSHFVSFKLVFFNTLTAHGHKIPIQKIQYLNHFIL